MRTTIVLQTATQQTALLASGLMTLVLLAMAVFAEPSMPNSSTSTYPLPGKAAGSLTVEIKPKAARQAGARWRVDGGAWQKSGNTANNLDVGDHEVSFKGVVGWKSPKAKDVTVTANQNTNTTGKYKQESNGNTQTINLPGNVPLEMVWIPAGSFMMGRYTNEQGSFNDESPQHQVTFANGFWMGRNEVTKAQWQAVMNTTPWSGQSYIITDPNSPAVYVSWNDAQLFITALNTHVTNTGQGAATFRLPSEAQWEYACRAGTTTRFYWGDDASYTQVGDYAWWRGNAFDVSGQEFAHAVGLKLPNAWALDDMIGNIWELCEDWYHSNYTGTPTDGSAWVSPTGSTRVVRGGSWFYNGTCRSATRGSSINLSYGDSNIGFRLAR